MRRYAVVEDCRTKLTFSGRFLTYVKTTDLGTLGLKGLAKHRSYGYGFAWTQGYLHLERAGRRW